MGTEGNQYSSLGKDEGEEGTRGLNIIRARQWSFMGHLLRENDGIECHIIKPGAEESEDNRE